MLLPKQLVKIRHDLGLTQEGFAQKIKASTVLVRMTETGLKPVSRQYMQKLANALGKDLIVRFKPKK